MSTFVDEEGPIIGIDLGTTYSCVAVFDSTTQNVQVLSNSLGKILAIVRMFVISYTFALFR